MTHSTKTLDAVVAGDLFIDLVMTGFRTLPKLGEEGFAQRCDRSPGGGAAHTSSGLARLGLRSAVFGVVGSDSAAWMREQFSAQLVDTSMLVEHCGETTAITVAVSTPQDRVFYTHYGANVAFPELLRREETWERLVRARHVHFGFPVDPDLLRRVAVWLRAHGTTVSIDVGWQVEWLENPLVLEALREVNWFLPNEHEAEHMTGESDPRQMLEWFAVREIQAAVKLGPRGSAVLDDGGYLEVPPIPVDPVDTTGAGDCFNAGFLYGLLNGLPPGEVLRWANVCGGLSTRAAGGLAGFPVLEEARSAIAA